jgi:hypothetical protein
MEYIALLKGKKRYRLYISDIKKVFRLIKKKSISIPVFKEKNIYQGSTDADVEDNADFN